MARMFSLHALLSPPRMPWSSLENSVSGNLNWLALRSMWLTHSCLNDADAVCWACLAVLPRPNVKLYPWNSVFITCTYMYSFMQHTTRSLELYPKLLSVIAVQTTIKYQKGECYIVSRGNHLPVDTCILHTVNGCSYNIERLCICTTGFHQSLNCGMILCFPWTDGGGSGEMEGAEFKSHLLNSLCGCRYPCIYIQLASCFYYSIMWQFTRIIYWVVTNCEVNEWVQVYICFA